MTENCKTQDSNEQLHKELEQALTALSQALYNLIHNGSYPLEYIDRDWKTGAVRWANMNVGKHRLTLKATELDKQNPDGTEVTVRLPDNPISEEVLESWDRQSIQRDIDYHQRELDKLQKRKAELGAKTSV